MPRCNASSRRRDSTRARGGRSNDSRAVGVHAKRQARTTISGGHLLTITPTRSVQGLSFFRQAAECERGGYKVFFMQHPPFGRSCTCHRFFVGRHGDAFGATDLPLKRPHFQRELLSVSQPKEGIPCQAERKNSPSRSFPMLRVSKWRWGEVRPLPMAVKKSGVTEQTYS